MGKRGPQPRGPFSGKKAVMSTRLTGATKESLQSAADASGRSFSQEVEFRLVRSFAEDQRLEDVFGGRNTFNVMRMLAATIHAEGIDLDQFKAAALSVTDSLKSANAAGAGQVFLTTDQMVTEQDRVFIQQAWLDRPSAKRASA